MKAVSFVLTLLISLSAQAEKSAKHYDEVYNKKGRVRAAYSGVQEILDSMSAEDQKSFLDSSYERFGKDNKLDPMPRVISADEYDNVIKKGVDQRARALLAFLQDHYSGERKYTKFVSEKVIKRIIRRTGEWGFDGLIDPSRIAFPYGPDIVRDKKGVWRVIEDNPGFIGGPGDLKLARELMMENAPALETLLNPRDPKEFYKSLTDSYKKRAADAGGKAVFILSAYKGDAEDKRITDILASYGIESVRTDGKLKSLEVREDGVYLKRKFGPEEKVGFLVFNGEHAWMDQTHNSTFIRMLIEEAKEIAAMKDDRIVRKGRPTETLAPGLRDLALAVLEKPQSIKRLDAFSDKMLKEGPQWNDVQTMHMDHLSYVGLTKPILEGKVGANYSPGVDFIGDKELYVYVEDMIRFYLDEKPILRNIPTKRFADKGGELDRKLLDKVMENMTKYVIKKVDGRGGDAVWVGPKMNMKDLPEVRRLIEENPASFIVQEYMPISMLRSFGHKLIVDIRVIADVFTAKVGKKIRQFINIANTAWGRGISIDADGKVNISKNGREVTVLVRQSPVRRSCHDLFATPR